MERRLDAVPAASTLCNETWAGKISQNILAWEGVRYTHGVDNAPVCSPIRSTWITRMYAIAGGAQPMRSRHAIPHDLVAYYGVITW